MGSTQSGAGSAGSSSRTVTMLAGSSPRSGSSGGCRRGVTPSAESTCRASGGRVKAGDDGKSNGVSYGGESGERARTAGTGTEGEGSDVDDDGDGDANGAT